MQALRPRSWLALARPALPRQNMAAKPDVVQTQRKQIEIKKPPVNTYI